MKKSTKDALLAIAAVGAATALRKIVMAPALAAATPAKRADIAGLGDEDAYADWYYNQYLPWAQQQQQQNSQYVQQYYSQPSYGQAQQYYSQPSYGSAQQCVARGGIWDSFSNQCNNPNQAQNYQPSPYYYGYSPYQMQYGYGGAAQQCAAQGGLFDSFSNQCVTNQAPQYNQPSQPYQVGASYFTTESQRIDQLIEQGINSGLIYAARQTKQKCAPGASKYCNIIFMDSAGGKKRMTYKAAARYIQLIRQLSPSSSPQNYNYAYPKVGSANPPGAGTTDQDISWAIQE